MSFIDDLANQLKDGTQKDNSETLPVPTGSTITDIANKFKTDIINSAILNYSKPVIGDVDTKIIPGYISFAGNESGLLLQNPTWYPEDLPKFQITKNQRLAFWNWMNTPDYISRQYWQTKIYQNIPLSNFEQLRFDLAYKEAKELGFNETDCLRKATRKTFFGSLVVQWDDIVHIKIIAPGKCVWESVNGITMLMMGAQYFVDLFLKNPYNIHEPLMYGRKYGNALLDALDAYKLNLWLSNINFFQMPDNTPSFWDKLVGVYLPLAIVTVVSIATAGAGTPALVAVAGAVVAGQLAKNINDNIKSDAQKLSEQELKDLQAKKDAADAQANIAKKTLENNGIIPKNNTWLWIAGGVAMLLFYKNKKRK